MDFVWDSVALPYQAKTFNTFLLACTTGGACNNCPTGQLVIVNVTIPSCPMGLSHVTRWDNIVIISSSELPKMRHTNYGPIVKALGR